MTVDSDIWDAVKDRINEGNSDPIVCLLVDCLDEKKHNGKKIFVATESQICLFEESSKPNKSPPSTLLNFFKLTKLSFQNNKLEFEFNTIKFNISHPNITKITNVILKCICSIMSQEELPALNCSGFNLIYKPDPASRFAAKSYLEGKIISSSDIDSARSEFAEGSDELLLSQFSSFLNNLPLLLNCADFRTGYKRLVIDVVADANLLNNLISFLPSNKSFTEFSFSANITGNFAIFENSGNINQIKQLIFQDFKLDSKLLDSISKTIENSSLDLLQFSSCLDDNTFQQLISKLSALNKFNEIPVIDFSDNDASVLLSHLSMFTNTKKLVLRNCEIEILQFLESLFNVDGIKIESIDLTGNKCTKSSSGPLNILSSLNEIILDEVQFEYAQFDNLFTALMNHSPQEDKSYHVSLVSISLKESEWRLFLSKIDEISPSKLAKLNWSNNSINKAFIRFINSTKSLLSLNVSGCFDNTPETTCLIPTLIRQNYTIRELIIDTFDMNELEDEAVKSIVDNLERNFALKSLSLGDQPISDENAIELANSLMLNRRIKKLTYNFNGIEEKDTILKFFEKLADRGRSLYIKYPLDAINNLKDSIDDYEEAEETGYIENYKEGFIGQFNQLYHRVINGNKDIKVPEESISFANADGQIEIGGIDEGDEDDGNDILDGLNYDPIRKQNWTNNVASQVGASVEQMRQASAIAGDSGIHYQYVGLSQVPNQPNQVQPNYSGQTTNQLPGNLFDLDDDEILEVVNGHRKDPSKVEPNKLPISPEEYRLYKKSYNSDSLNNVPLGALPDLPPLGDIGGVSVTHQPISPNDLPALGNINMQPGSKLPPPPSFTNLGTLPPPPTGMVLPPPPSGMVIPPQPIYVTKIGEVPSEVAPYEKH